jgi:ABC-2 type transport system permease protein
MASVLSGNYSRSRRAEFSAVLTAETTKLRSVRSMVWTLAAVAAIVPVFAAFVGLTGSLQPDDTILGGSLTGSVGALMVAGALGAIVMTSEYGSNMIHTTFASSPRRSTVLAAKATLVASVLFLTAIVTCFVSYLIGTLLLSSDTYATGELMPALLGIGVCFSATGVLGLAVGVVLRNSAGAISAVIGFMLLPSLVGPLFGDFQRWLTGATPTSTLERLTQTSDATPEVVGSIGPWGGLAVLCAYSLAGLFVAALRLSRRDA